MANMEAAERPQPAGDREVNEDAEVIIDIPWWLFCSCSPLNETELHRAVWQRAPRTEFKKLRDGCHDTWCFAFHPNIDGMPPLYLAVYLGDSDTATNLIETFGALMSYGGPNGQNVLHVAALRSRDLTRTILQIRGDLRNKADDSGNTPLHFAASAGIPGITSLLVDGNNANAILQRNNSGMCPIHIAASVGAMDAIRALVGGGRNDTADAATAADAALSEALDHNGGTFLHVAVANKKTDVVKFVCGSSWPRFKEILNMKDNDGNTALHLAVRKRDESIFSHLLGNRHVELNHVNREGYTPLDLASSIKMQHPFASLQNPTEWMIRALAHSGGHFFTFSARRRQSNNNCTSHIQGGGARDHPRELAGSTESVLVASALIATLTFAAAFTMPGSYKTDGQPKTGTPALGGHYGFKVFLVADILAFYCSVASTFSLAEYGSRGNVDPLARCVYAQRAVKLFHVALRSVIVAFALGVSVVMWDISVVTTIVVGVATLALVLYGNIALGHDVRLVRVMHRRFGFSRSWSLHPATSAHLDWRTRRLKSFSATVALNIVDLSWTYILIFLLAGIAQLIKL